MKNQANQILFCRTVKRVLLRLIPLFLLAGIMVLSVISFFLSAGWDALIWVILFCLCAAPAVGYGLAWGVYGIGRAAGRRSF